MRRIIIKLVCTKFERFLYLQEGVKYFFLEIQPEGKTKCRHHFVALYHLKLIFNLQIVTNNIVYNYYVILIFYLISFVVLNN